MFEPEQITHQSGRLIYGSQVILEIVGQVYKTPAEKFPVFFTQGAACGPRSTFPERPQFLSGYQILSLFRKNKYVTGAGFKGMHLGCQDVFLGPGIPV